MNNHLQNIEIEEDEVSLIEFVAVMLRYRNIILGTVLVSFFVSIIAILFLPTLHQKESDEILSLEATASLVFSNNIHAIIDNDTLFSYISQIITDPEIFLEALKLTKSDSFAGINLTNSDEVDILGSLRDLLDENNGVFILDNIGNQVILKLKLYDSFDSDLFYRSLVDLTNKRLYLMIQPLAEGKIWEYKNIIIKEYPLAIFNANQQHIYNLYTSASRFYSQYVPILTIIQRPYTKRLNYKDEYSRDVLLVKLILLSLMAILFSIFISFFLNKIRIIKNDPRSMDILRKAAQRGRE